jgi:hypothetical protein
MGKPMNPDVRFVFDNDADEAAVQKLGINTDDGFLFAYAEVVPSVGCAQIRLAVLAKSQDDFTRLVPLAKAAGLPIPDSVVAFVDPQKSNGPFLQSCCVFSRDVEVIALGDADADSGTTLRSVQRNGQSLIIVDDDRNPDPKLRGILGLHITPGRIRKDCRQL